MYGPPLTRAEIGLSVGLKGKDLAAFIKREREAGRLVSRLAYIDPINGVGGRVTLYQTVPKTIEMPLNEPI